ncbi:unnamed protein product [Mucor hiemalis]
MYEVARQGILTCQGLGQLMSRFRKVINFYPTRTSFTHPSNLCYIYFALYVIIQLEQLQSLFGIGYVINMEDVADDYLHQQFTTNSLHNNHQALLVNFTF